MTRPSSSSRQKSSSNNRMGPHNKLVKGVVDLLKISYGSRIHLWRPIPSLGSALHLDIYACIDGRLAAFEVKTGKARLSKNQTKEVEDIRRAGGVAEEIRCLEAAERVIRDQLPPPSQRLLIGGQL